MPAWMTSLLRLLVSVPTALCCSIRTVDVGVSSLWVWRRRAMARPTAPPPITAWVKSACARAVLLKCLHVGRDDRFVMDRNALWRRVSAAIFSDLYLSIKIFFEKDRVF